MKRLDIGAGHTPYRTDDPEWEHLDARPLEHIEYVADQKQLPFEDETWDVLRSSHTIEHEWWCDTEAMVREWYRVLKPQGYMIIHCPDLLYMAQRIVAAPERSSEHTPLMHGAPQFAIPRRDGVEDTPYNTHRANFTAQSLTKLLLDCGFVKVEVLSVSGEEPSLSVIAYKGLDGFWPAVIPPTPLPQGTGLVGKHVFIAEMTGIGDMLDTVGLIDNLKQLGATRFTLCTHMHGDCSLWRNLPGVTTVPGTVMSDGVSVLVDSGIARIELRDSDVRVNFNHRDIKSDRTISRVEQKLEWMGVDYSSLDSCVIRAACKPEAHVANEAEQVKQRLGIGDQFVVVHGTSRSKTRTLPERIMQDLITQLSTLCQVVLLGHGERPYANCIDATQGLPLDVVSLIVKQSALFVGVDSSMAHMAWAWDIPMVVCTLKHDKLIFGNVHGRVIESSNDGWQDRLMDDIEATIIATEARETLLRG